MALAGVSLEVPQETLFCLVGPNGAGKTTFIRIASTQLLPSSGNIFVMGYDAIKEPEKVRRLVSVMPQEGNAGRILSAWENIYYYLLARGMERGEARDQTRRTMEALGLWEIKDSLTMKLSGGFRRRVLAAMALASGADVVFLDEPTAGLDPIARREFWGYIRGMVREGQTIIFSTHMLNEAEQVSDFVTMMTRGRIVFKGTPSEAKKLVKSSYRVVLKGRVSPSILEGKEHRTHGDMVYVYCEEEEAVSIVERAIREGIEATVRPVGLEDAFVKVMEGDAQVP